MSSLVTAAVRSVAGKITRSGVGDAQVAPAGVDDRCLGCGHPQEFYATAVARGGSVATCKRPPAYVTRRSTRRRARRRACDPSAGSRRRPIVTGRARAARAKASASPGSGGRHQQRRRARRVRTERRLDRAHDDRREPSHVRLELLGRAARAPVEHQVGRPGRGLLHRRLPAIGRSAAAATSTPVAGRAGSALMNAPPRRAAKPSSGDGCSSSRSVRICDVGASTPGTAARQLAQLVGSRERSEALEQPVDEVHLRLRERRAEPDAPSRDSVPGGRLDHVAARRSASDTCCRAPRAGARRQRGVERVGDLTQRAAALVAVEAHVAAGEVLLGARLLPAPGIPITITTSASPAGAFGPGTRLPGPPNAASSATRSSCPSSSAAALRGAAGGLGPPRARDRDRAGERPSNHASATSAGVAPRAVATSISGLASKHAPTRRGPPNGE